MDMEDSFIKKLDVRHRASIPSADFIIPAARKPKLTRVTHLADLIHGGHDMQDYDEAAARA